MARLPHTLPWRERYAALQVPSWVPDDVQSVMRDYWGNQLGEPEIVALAERLLTDPRMEKVWHELLRKNRKTGDYLHLSDNMKRVLGCDRANEVYPAATATMFLETLKAGAAVLRINSQKAVGYLEKSFNLQDDAAFLRRMNKERRLGDHAREVSKLAGVLDKAADAYRRVSKMAGLEPVGYRLFDDSQLAAKFFTVEMAKTMRGHFGSPLYATITTLCRIALQDDTVTQDAVREWCAHPGEP